MEKLKTPKDYWDMVAWFKDMQALDPTNTVKNNKLQQAINQFTEIACFLETLENKRQIDSQYYDDLYKFIT